MAMKIVFAMISNPGPSMYLHYIWVSWLLHIAKWTFTRLDRQNCQGYKKEENVVCLKVCWYVGEACRRRNHYMVE